MKTVGRIFTSAVLGIVVLCGALGMLGACSNQSSAPASIVGSSAASSAATQALSESERSSEEDWEKLNSAIQKAEAYTDLSIYTQESAELLRQSRDWAYRVAMDEGCSRSDVTAAAIQLESVMLIMQ